MILLKFLSGIVTSFTKKKEKLHFETRSEKIFEKAFNKLWKRIIKNSK